MIEAFTAAQVRAAEEPLLARGVPLMERAAFALAHAVVQELRGGVGGQGAAAQGGVGAQDRARRVAGARVVLLVGAGNNGGDALFAGARLARRGVEVRALLASRTPHAEGLAALRRAGGRVVDLAGAHREVDVEGARRGGSTPAGSGRGHAGRAGPALSAVDRADAWESAISAVLAADVVVDGLVGIGASGALRGVAGDLVEAIVDARGRAAGARAKEGVVARRRGDGRVVAVDVPSGIGVDDGSVPGPVLPADRTMTFGAAKAGLLLPPATRLAGRVTVVDLGLADLSEPVVRRLDLDDVARLWPVPGPTDHKYTRGVLGVVAGTPTFPGAAVLTVTAAVRAGAGMVRSLGPDDVTRAVLSARPEAVPAEGRVQAWALGSGVPAVGERGASGSSEPSLRGTSLSGRSDASMPGGPEARGYGPEGGRRIAGEDSGGAGQHERIRRALAEACGEAVEADAGARSRAEGGAGRRVPAVVDAGALSLLLDRCPPSVVLTPHAGELATLLSTRGEDVDRAEVEAEPLRWATVAHELTGATVLLKGSTTVIVGPEGAWSQADGPAWLATAGSGDVLTGILGALLAAHSERVMREPGLAARLAAMAVTVHGVAGRRANPGGPVAALDVADALPAALAELLRGTGAATPAEGDDGARRGRRKPPPRVTHTPAEGDGSHRRG
ncbi:bifunctional ADP-dependent NAD(P)H-hydrate dehydratase/NAD(P)H-hydrate epimerase [Oerskovia turbata]